MQPCSHAERNRISTLTLKIRSEVGIDTGCMLIPPYVTTVPPSLKRIMNYDNVPGIRGK
jgi:hypothetical protein